MSKLTNCAATCLQVVLLLVLKCVLHLKREIISINVTNSMGSNTLFHQKIILLCWNQNLRRSPSWKCPAHPEMLVKNIEREKVKSSQVTVKFTPHNLSENKLRNMETENKGLKGRLKLLMSLPDRWSQSERWGRRTWRWKAGTRCQDQSGRTRHWPLSIKDYIFGVLATLCYIWYCIWCFQLGQFKVLWLHHFVSCFCFATTESHIFVVTD